VKSVRWGTTMASYRVYCLDDAGHISLADWIEAKDDEEALAHARQLKIGARRCEVWQGKRLVATFSDQRLTPPNHDQLFPKPAQGVAA
jgi:hypothetical protein